MLLISHTSPHVEHAIYHPRSLILLQAILCLKKSSLATGFRIMRLRDNHLFLLGSFELTVAFMFCMEL